MLKIEQKLKIVQMKKETKNWIKKFILNCWIIKICVRMVAKVSFKVLKTWCLFSARKREREIMYVGMFHFLWFNEY